MAFRGEDMARTLGWLKQRQVEYRLMRAPDPFMTWQLFFPDPNGVEVKIDFARSEPQPPDWAGNMMRQRT